jgi:hypothetical protein
MAGPMYPLSAPFVRVKLSPAAQGVDAQAVHRRPDRRRQISPDTGTPGGTVVGYPRIERGTTESRGQSDVFGVVDVSGEDRRGVVRLRATGRQQSGRSQPVPLEGDAGVSYKGLIPAHANDTSGIMFGIARVGANAKGFDQDIRFYSGNPWFPMRDCEAVREATYQARVTLRMTLQPDVQYVFHPVGHVLNPDGSIRRDALVFGLHSVLNF